MSTELIVGAIIVIAIVVFFVAKNYNKEEAPESSLKEDLEKAAKKIATDEGPIEVPVKKAPAKKTTTANKSTPKKTTTAKKPAAPKTGAAPKRRGRPPKKAAE